jgi:lipopolysaccharide/colanic/teichoic acid biosynthesis glycosyltransferase
MGSGSPSSRSGALERVFALLLLLLSAPLIAVLALAIRITAGRPVFHRGTRLGRDKRPFQMLKLRTLRVGAEKVTRGELLSPRHDLTIRGGRFLRDTRLDELPQLLNIVRGEMSFVGPRPERPEVLETKCLGIPGYERRFAVRPGLIGISQLFTPHGTPKRYRTLLDNAVIRSGSRGARCRRIVAFTIWAVTCEVCRRVARQLAAIPARAVGRFREKRRMHRIVPHGATALLRRPGSASGARVLDLNEEAVLVECQHEPALGPITELVLQIPLPRGGRPCRRTARCKGMVSERRNGSARSQLVIRYEPCTPRSEYMIHQYFLRDSLAVPRPKWRGPLPALPRSVPSLPAPVPTPAPQPVLARCASVRGVYR